MMKTFTVDWDDYAALSILGNQVKCRLGEINPNRVSRKEKTRKTIDLCKSIYDTDISEVYSQTALDVTPMYYVYAHLDTSKSIAIGRHGVTTFAATLGMDYFPFYIGKGTGNRWCDLNRNETHRKVRAKLTTLEKEPKAIKILDGLTEMEALMIESKLIDIFGLIPYGGLLVNLDEGINRDERRHLYRSEFDQLRQLNRML